MGSIASILVCAPARSGGAHPLLLWIFGDEGHPKRPFYWIGGWALAGGIVAILTTPHWQTPWYKYERLHFDDKEKDNKAA